MNAEVFDVITQKMIKGLPFKELDLISPETAQKAGIPAESPVFVSPSAKHERICGSCTTTYGPLVYQAGYRTLPHHFHEREIEGGGIYFLLKRTKDDPYFISKYGLSWVADITLGTRSTYYSIGKLGGRSSSVVVNRIRAYCKENNGFEHPEGPTEIKEGIAMEGPWGHMKAICEDHFSRKKWRNLQTYRFHTGEDNAINFSAI